MMDYSMNESFLFFFRSFQNVLSREWWRLLASLLMYGGLESLLYYYSTMYPTQL